MLMAHDRATMDATWPQSYQPLWAQASLFPATDGAAQVWSLAQPESPLGGYWTPNFSECRNAGAVSLSSVLEPPESIPQKYYLSAKACLGILRRAAARGTTLPRLLELALQRRAST
jgi:hypothetical protein